MATSHARTHAHAHVDMPTKKCTHMHTCKQTSIAIAGDQAHRCWMAMLCICTQSQINSSVLCPSKPSGAGAVERAMLDTKEEPVEAKDLQRKVNEAWEALCGGDTHPGQWLQDKIQGHEAEFAEA